MSQNSSMPADPAANLNLRGAVDLSALKSPRPAAGAAPAGASRFAVDVNEQSFQELVGLSSQVPVIVSLGASWSSQSASLNATLELLMNEYNGKMVLGRVDAEISPQIAQAFGAVNVPTVVALVKGQPVPLFEGELPQEQIRRFLDELLQVAATNGVSGSLNGEAPAEAEEPPLPPLHQEAFDAISAGDFDAAEAAYEKALAEKPNDSDAKVGLAQVHLMKRTAAIDTVQAEALRSQAAGDPDNLDAHLAVADLDVTGGHVEDAFARIVKFISLHFGPERETARVRLLELYDVVGVTDPRVAASRQALARALF
jgi:putative thioredoxin